MLNDIEKLEGKILDKASALMTQGDILESMKVYILLLDLEGSRFALDTEFILKLIRQYINIHEYEKALQLVERGLRISIGEIKMWKQKKEIYIHQLDYVGIKEVSKVIDKIEEDVKSANIDGYLEHIKNDYLCVNDNTGEDAHVEFRSAIEDDENIVDVDYFLSLAEEKLLKKQLGQK